MQPGIHHFKNPAMTEIEFEWHSASGKVYAIDITQHPVQGDIVAEGINDYDTAKLIVRTWSRGYRKGFSMPRSVVSNYG